MAYASKFGVGRYNTGYGKKGGGNYNASGSSSNYQGGKQDMEEWSPDKGPFEEWVCRKEPEKGDPAHQLMFDRNNMVMLPPQCKHCKNYGRRLRYRKGTSITEFIHSYCEKCRHFGLKLKNYEWYFFKKLREHDPNPYVQENVVKKRKRTAMLESDGSDEDGSGDEEVEQPKKKKKIASKRAKKAVAKKNKKSKEKRKKSKAELFEENDSDDDEDEDGDEDDEE